MAELGWILRTQLRYAFFRRPVIQEGYDFDPKTEPVVLPADEDLVDVAVNPEVLG